MRPRFLVAGVTTLSILAGVASAAAQSEQPSIELTVNAGSPLRIALDERIQLKHVGQPVTGTVIEPVYAYDRIVIAAGTKVRGHVAGIDEGSSFTRIRAYATGNLSPAKQAVVTLDTLVLDDGTEVAVETGMAAGLANVTRRMAGGSKSVEHEPSTTNDDGAKGTLGARAHDEIKRQTTGAFAEAKQKSRDGLASIKALRNADQWRRLRDAAVQQLPYHPQYLAKGTVYSAELSSPIQFGRVVPASAAPPGTPPAPDSILTARLVTTLDSSKTPRGTPFEAVITQTVFSADHRVILPEGTRLMGEVTLATPAGRFHRNGRLRFHFERVQIPNQEVAPLLGALHAVDASEGDRVAVDDEGGATLQNSKTRFIAPALALLSLHGALEGDGHSYADPDGDGSVKTAGSGAGSRGVGGFIGMGAIGAVLGPVSRPLGIALTVYGAARTVYTNVLAKGREVTFIANTPIQVRLAPGPLSR